MDLATGAMKSLLPKLGELLKEEYKLQASVEGDIQYLQRELQSMHAALRKVAEVPRDQLEEHDRLWAGDVRELSQDIEDILDSFLVGVQGADSFPAGVEGSDPSATQDCLTCLMALAEMCSLFKKAMARHDIGTAIKGMKNQVHEVATRDDRYRGRGGVVPAPARQKTVSIDPLLSVLHENQKIVGLDKARDEIIQKLFKEGDVSKQQLKVLSIVGFGGLGKTTLAKLLYDTLQEGFDCRAFVSVSRSPDMGEVLKELFYELDEKVYDKLNVRHLGERQLIGKLREFLRAKRYLIVIDDIWDTNAWKLLKYVLKDNNCGSRVITTTRNVDVSKACCSLDYDLIHKMEPLSEGESKNLFYNRIFSSETRCPPELEQVSKDILQKCGGVPLAITTLASHLASNQKVKPKSQWYVLLNSIGRGLTKGDANVDEMKRILSFSYYDLPSHLKTCLLYLSIFPEDSIIDKGRLIRKWIAEGFIQGDNLFELGESYFNELINRSMIEPVYSDVGYMADGCRVHDMMRDLICDLSSEENFVTVLDGDTPFDRRVRRVSLQRSMTKLTKRRVATTSMSQVRSFTISSPANDQMLPLTRFQALRVLDLQGYDLRNSFHLKFWCIGNLLQLRYLGLRNTGIDEIPVEIGKLLFLQILDLRGVNTDELPAVVVSLRNLMCLYLMGGACLPVGFRCLTSLEELTGHFSKERDIEELGYLTQLRVLSIFWPSRCSIWTILALVKSLRKLSQLQSLEIKPLYSELVDNIDPLRLNWMPPPHIRRLVLGGWFQMLPTWISSTSLPLLSYLKIKAIEVRPEDIHVVGTLPALRYVELESSLKFARKEEHAKERFMLSGDAFPCARECHFKNVILESGMFTPGAMPMVRHLEFGLRVSDIPIGCDLGISIRNLPSLEQASIRLHGEKRSSERFSEAEAALRQTGNDHPNSPRIIIQNQV